MGFMVNGAAFAPQFQIPGWTINDIPASISRINQVYHSLTSVCPGSLNMQSLSRHRRIIFNKYNYLNNAIEFEYQRKTKQ